MSIASLMEAESVALPQWEYMVVPLRTTGGLWKKSVHPDVSQLNELGRQGWEAVGLSLQAGDLVAKPVVLLKRPTH